MFLGIVQPESGNPLTQKEFLQEIQLAHVNGQIIDHGYADRFGRTLIVVSRKVDMEKPEQEQQEVIQKWTESERILQELYSQVFETRRVSATIKMS